MHGGAVPACRALGRQANGTVERSSLGCHPCALTVAHLVTSGRRRSLLFASCCFRPDWLFFASLHAVELYIHTVSATNGRRSRRLASVFRRALPLNAASVRPRQLFNRGLGQHADVGAL